MTPEHKALAAAVAAQLQLNPAPGYDDLWTPVFVMPDGGRLQFSDGRAHGHSRFIRDCFADSKACQLAGVRLVLSKTAG